jgi:hypothetical protein
MATINCSYNGGSFTTNLFMSGSYNNGAKMEIKGVTYDTSTGKYTISYKCTLYDKTGDQGRYNSTARYIAFGGEQQLFETNTILWSNWENGTIIKESSYITSSTNVSVYVKVMFDYTYSDARWNAGTKCVDGASTLSITPAAASFNLNILNPDDSEPYQTGEAGTVEQSINGGSYTRVYNEGANSYTIGTTFNYRNFTPGAHRELSSVTGISPSNTTGPWSLTLSSSGASVNFKTAWKNYTFRTYKGEGTTEISTITQQYNTTYNVPHPTPPTGYLFAGFYSTGSLSSISSKDSVFESGNGGIEVYNNSANGTVTHTRVQDDDGVPSACKYFGNGGRAYYIRIDKAAGTASPYCGGFYLSTNSAANHIYRHIIWAKIPVGYTIGDYRNSIGDGGRSEWLTDTAGTGDWYRYVYDVHAGSSGDFSTLGFVAIRANNGDDNAAVTWYVCATQVTDITNNYATYTFDANGTAEYFYAPVAYNIAYDANGGSNAPSTQVKTYGQNLVLSSQIPTYNGYDFVGWAQAGEDTIYSPGQTLSSDLSRYSGATITFYAVWVQDQARLSVNKNSTWSQGKGYFKKNNEWKKIKTIYTKVNGEWKAGHLERLKKEWEEVCCFIKGSQVRISLDGTTKNIEDLKAGEQIVVYNEDEKKFELSTVSDTPRNNNVTDKATIVLENGITIEMNAYHPLLTIEGYHSLTGHEGLPLLTDKDILVTINGEIKIKQIVRETIEPITMYNLSVNGEHHNYVVNSVVAHNANCPVK